MLHMQSAIQVPGGDDKEMQRGGKQGEYGDVDDEDLEKADKGQQDANKQRVEQQGGQKATTSLPGKTEQGREQSGVADSNRKGQVCEPYLAIDLAILYLLGDVKPAEAL